jgi:hypothetical protein
MRCARIYHIVIWVGMEIREPSRFHGVTNLESFLTHCEDEVLENQRILALDIALKDTPAEGSDSVTERGGGVNQ